MNFLELTKLKQGEKGAIISPSFAALGVWPDVYELGWEMGKMKDKVMVKEEWVIVTGKRG